MYIFVFLPPAMLMRLRNLLLIFSLLLIGACSEYQKVEKSNDVNYKLTKANEYYDKKQYQRANEIYNSILGVMKNTRNYEALYYRYAYTFYYMRSYLEASYHFKNFVDFFPRSKDADECEFMHGVCLYKYAPKYSLDQTNTVKAQEALQSYVNTHVSSPRVKEANTYIAECRAKLERKDADAAKLYYNISQYKAAVIAYKSVMRNYPESASSDYYQYMALKSAYYYAKGSIPTKQEERYVDALNTYREFVDNHPKSAYIGDAEKVYILANNNIKKIRDEQHQ